MNNTDPIISPASSLMHNGIAIFQDFNQLDGFITPYTLTMNLMVVCTQGAISATIDLTTRRMNAGSIMFLRPGHTIHDITKTADFSGFFLLAEETKYSSVLPLAGANIASALLFFRNDSIINVEPADMENIKLIYALLRKKMFRLTLPYSHIAFNTLCDLLFYETMSIYTTVMERRNNRPTRREELLTRFINLVEENFRTERSVAFYAERLCRSPKHLSAVMKQATGLTAGEWIDRKVVREAKILLRNSPKTIQQISEELNFANQSFFGKYFKNLTGITPRQYRAKPE